MVIQLFIFHRETNLVSDAGGRAGIKMHRPRILPFHLPLVQADFLQLSYLRVYRTHKSIPGSDPQNKTEVKMCLLSSNSFFYSQILLAFKFSLLAYTNQLLLEIIVDGVRKSLKIPFNFFVLIEVTKSIHQSWILEVSLSA